MTAISTPQTKNPGSLSPNVIERDEGIFENEKHQTIYKAFLYTLENLEKKTEEDIQKFKKLPKQETKELQDYVKKSLAELTKHLSLLQNEDERKIFTFILANHENIFNNVDHKKIKEISEENFPQFLLSVYKKIRAKNLAGEKSLNKVKIQEIVNECVNDIRGTETVDSLKKFVGSSFGIKIDTKNFGKSVKDGLLEKIPILGKFFGKGEKEEEDDEPVLTNEGAMKQFLRKSFLPIVFFAIAMLLSGPIGVFGLFTIPHIVVISIAVIAFVSAECKAAKVFFSTDKKDTVHNPDSDQCVSCHEQDIVGKSAELAAKREEEAAKKKDKELGEKISKDIYNTVLTPLTKGAENRAGSNTSIEKVSIQPHEKTQSDEWQQMVKEKKAGRGGNDGPRVIQ